ncbi:MAG: hypothetical protein ACOYUK_04600 [Patescibacteria group bacterium]
MPKPGASNQVEDIFAESDSSNAPGAAPAQPTARQKRRPVRTVPASRSRVSPAVPKPTAVHTWSGRRRMMLVTLPLVVVAIVAVVLALGPFGIVNPLATPAPSANENQVVQPGQSATTADSGSGIDIPVVTVSIIDTDGDGISDDEEERIGTDSQQADTDRDGLPDFDEVEIYGTNPRNPDTDGDGNNDGTEVKYGYNPNGDGLLRDLNAAIEELNKS